MQASSLPESTQRRDIVPPRLSLDGAVDAQARRTVSTSAIAASPFANGDAGTAAGLHRTGSPALGAGRPAAVVAAGLPSLPSAPLSEQLPPEGCSTSAAEATSSPAKERSAHAHDAPPASGTASPSISGILTALPNRGPAAAVAGRWLGSSPRSGPSGPRSRGTFASHPIPEESEQVSPDDAPYDSSSSPRAAPAGLPQHVT
jgi:hypothetical protein